MATAGPATVVDWTGWAMAPTLTMRGSAFLALLLAVPVFCFPSATYAEDTTLEAHYAVSISGLPIGRVETTARFNRNGYAAVINASVAGISRLVSDARATLLGSGRIAGNRVFPTSYSLETNESGFQTHVRMSMRHGAVTDLLAVPHLRPAFDRIPLEAAHRRGIIDPVGAFLIVSNPADLADGKQICDRTLSIFDGWQRFDIRLDYKHTLSVSGTNDGYDGDVIVCAARYIPIAGHRQKREAVRFMTSNKRLEISYALLGDLPFLVPRRILIGTKYGDLVISSTRFRAADRTQRAAN